MKELDYAGEPFFVTNRVATALLNYARALADRGSADTVDIPAFDELGKPLQLQMLIGPASQIVTRSTDVDFTQGKEYNDDEVVATIENATARLQPSRPVPEPLQEPDDLWML